MKTTVVNIKDTDEYDVFIGRPSKWGNPFSHINNTSAHYKVSTRKEAVDKYRKWILTQDDLMESLPELEGKILGCYCKPKMCHGDVLVEIIRNRHFKSLF